MNTNVGRVLFAVAAFHFIPMVAQAQTSGWVTGRIHYYENNGNFCDDRTAAVSGVNGQGQDCTSARYLGNRDWHRELPVMDARAYVYATRVVNGVTTNLAVAATTATDALGMFTTQWSASFTPTALFFVWSPDHKDNRFRIRDKTGGQYAMFGNQAAPQASTASQPQQLGTLVTGSATAPNMAANVYAMAQRMVTGGLMNHTGMQLSFTNIEVRSFFAKNEVGPLGTACPTACAGHVNGQGYVHLTTADAFDPQARILHELGHIASQRLNTRRQVGDYCWPDIRAANGFCTDVNFDGVTETDRNGDGVMDDADGDGVADGPGWNLWSGEWSNVAFEEGLATFIGDQALYGRSNPQVTTCLSNDACVIDDPLQQVERSTGSGVLSACSANNDAWRRSAAMVDRYLRDVYDNSNDSAGCPAGTPSCQRNSSFNDTTARAIEEVLNVIVRFPGGLGDHQDEEPFNSGGAIDDRDGFRAQDYYWNYLNTGTPSVNTNDARNYNCVLF